MFGLNKKQEPEPMPEENQLLIPVKDIKQYLVEEYERVGKLNDQLKKQEDEIEKAKEVEFKYKATLVTLDEFDRRLKSKDSEINNLKTKIEEKDRRICAITDDLNSYKVIFNQNKITKEGLTSEIESDFASRIINAVNDLKGNIAKKSVTDLIEQEMKKSKA